jgi:hypothetical protein
MKAIDKNRWLRGWILLMMVCTIALIAADILLPAGRSREEEYPAGRPEPGTGYGMPFTDSPVELLPADTHRIKEQDSISNALKNLPEYEGQQTNA